MNRSQKNVRMRSLLSLLMVLAMMLTLFAPAALAAAPAAEAAAVPTTQSTTMPETTAPASETTAPASETTAAAPETTTAAPETTTTAETQPETTTAPAAGVGSVHAESTLPVLAGLVLNGGQIPLAPAVFTADNLGYSAGVSTDTASVTVTATLPAGSSDTITVNGSAAQSGVATAPIALSVGTNEIKVTVAPPSGVGQDYTITVQRAAPPAAATVDGTGYSTLQDAVNAAAGKTVLLARDADITAGGLTIAGASAVTVDLNGHVITCAGTAGGNIAVTGIAVFKDSTDTNRNGGGTGSVVSAQVCTDGLFTVNNGASLTCESGLYNSSSLQNGSRAVNVLGGGVFTLNGGAMAGAGVVQCGLGAQVYVGGGTMKGASNAIHCTGSCTVSITGGDVAGAGVGVWMEGGILLISGGSVRTTAQGLTAPVYLDTPQTTPITLNISGGRFSTQSGSATFYLAGSGTVNWNITGGTFADNPTAHLDPARAGIVQNADGTWTVRPFVKATGLKLAASSVTMLPQAQQALPQVTLLPASAAEIWTWTSQNTGLVTVSGGKLVAANACGTTTVTAATPEGVKAVLTVHVTPLPADQKLQLSLTDYEAAVGGETGFTYTLHIAGTPGGAEMTSWVNVVSSNPKVCTVDNTAHTATFTGTGSAVLTARLTGDYLSRTAVLSVRGVAPQARTLRIGVAGESVGTVFQTQQTDGSVTAVTADASAVTLGKSVLLLTADMADAKGGTAAPAVLWTSSDPSVAAVSKDRQGNTLLTVRTAGTVCVTAAAQDNVRTVSSFTLTVRDYAPTLTGKSFTLNRALADGVPLEVHTAFGNAIQTVAVQDANGAALSFFTVSGSGESWTLGFTSADDRPAPRTYSAVLHFTTSAGKGTYDFPVTIRVMQSLPAVTVKVTGSVNTFYTANTGVAIAVTSKNVRVSSLALTGTPAFVHNFSIADNGAVTVNADLQSDPGSTRPANSGTLHILLEGYAVGLDVRVTIPVVNTRPSFRLDRSAVNVYTGSTNDRKIYVRLMDAAGRNEQDLSDVSVSYAAGTTSGAFSGVPVIGGSYIILESTGVKGTAKLSLTSSAWTQPLVYSLSVSTLATPPVVKPSAVSAKLNRRMLSGEVAVLDLTVQNNLTNLGVESLTPALAAKAGQNADDVHFEVHADQLYVTLSDTAKAGTYSYTMTPTLSSGSDSFAGKPFAFTVTVLDTVPVVKLSAAAVTLNRRLVNGANGETAVLQATVQNNTGSLSLSGVSAALAAKAGQNAGDVTFTTDSSGTIRVKLTAAAQKGTYAYTLTPALTDGYGSTAGTPVKVTVTVLDAAPSGTGTTDTLNPLMRGVCLPVRLTMKNISGTPVSASTNAEHFMILVDSGTLYVCIKDGQAVSSGTYSVQVDVAFRGIDGTFPVTVRVPVREALPLAKVQPAVLTWYDRFSTDAGDNTIGVAQFVLQNVTNARIESVQPLYSADLQKTFGYRLDTLRDTLTITATDASRLRAGSTTALRFRVFYVNGGQRSAGSSIVTVNIRDQSAVLRAK